MKKVMMFLAFALSVTLAACADPADVYDDPVSRIDEALDAIEIPAETADDLDLPATSEGESVVWESDNPDVIGADGTVTQQATDTVVTLTATVAINEFENSRDFEVTVLAE